jgi:hypothetical protein
VTRPKLRRLPATPVPPRRRTRHHWRTSGEGNIVLPWRVKLPHGAALALTGRYSLQHRGE